MARSVNAPFLRARPLGLDRVAPSPLAPRAREEAAVDAAGADGPPGRHARRPPTPLPRRPRKRRSQG